MNTLIKIITLIIPFLLTGCYAHSLCGSYDEIPALDRNGDGEIDYRYQVIGDSILDYHDITCESVGHRLGFELNDRVESRSVTGAKLYEIQEQYNPPVDQEADYEYVIANGGLNDLLSNSHLTAPELPGCDCNGQVNHDSCLQEVEGATNRMSDLIDNIQETSAAEVVLVTYYPAETTDSFIGECFPYVEMLNQGFRDLAAEDDSVHVVETYGPEQQVISKVNIFGEDNYHPTAQGSEQIALSIKDQLGLEPVEPLEPEEPEEPIQE